MRKIIRIFPVTDKHKRNDNGTKNVKTPASFLVNYSAAALAILVLASGRPATATTIDFESVADSTILTNQIPGLSFTNTAVITGGISLDEFEFPPHSGSNVAFDNGGPISIDFDTPQSAVSGYFTYAEPLTFSAFDASNNLLGSVSSAYANNEALSGDPGSLPNEFLSLSFSDISSVTIAGDPFGSSFVLDDLSFTQGSPASVPEPGSLTLLGSGLIALTYLKRRRATKRT